MFVRTISALPGLLLDWINIGEVSLHLRFAFFVLLAALRSHSAFAERLTTATGYGLVYDVYPADGPAALIFMHGKNGGHGSPLMKSFAERVAQSGCTVYLPRMPWSRFWDGTLEDAVSAIDALVDIAAKNGQKVFVGGQSLGANFTTVYRPTDPPPAVIGKVMTSPGGLLDLTAPNAKAFWDSFMPSVERARELDRTGKGKEKAKFSGTNVVGTKSIEEHYETRRPSSRSSGRPESRTRSKPARNGPSISCRVIPRASILISTATIIRR